MAEVIDEIKEFYDACTEFLRSNFILTKTKLSAIFKAIASSRMLSNFFYNAEDGFKINKAKEACFLSSRDGESYIKMVVLPENDRDKIAFIFYLLVEINKNCIEADGEKLSFYIFLMRYFGPSDDRDKCFMKFSEQIMIPFRDISCKYLSNAVSGTETQKIDATATYEQKDKSDGVFKGGQDTVDTEKTDIDEAVKEPIDEFTYILDEESAALARTGMDAEALAEGFAILNALSETYNKCEYRIAKALLSGYKYFLLGYSYTSKRIEKLNCILESINGEEENEA